MERNQPDGPPADPPRIDDELPDTTLFWRWVGKATRPVVGWVLVGLGALAILIGWIGVSGEALVAKQIPYLVSGGIGGMVLVAVGAFLLGTDDLRQDLQRLDRLEQMVDQLHGVLLVEEGADDEGSPSPNGSRQRGRSRAVPSELVALPRGRSYHLAECAMVAGKDVETVDASGVELRGLTPCSLCEPAPAEV